ncbi:MAG: hypothetical protein PHV30_10745 [Candidatus Margulisbacteria bacterium]|nr:hypothetical protein [Candidatus Margulisiibacteriota bacterium]
MAKVKGPLNSLRARGRFAGVLDFRDYPAGSMHESRVYIQPQRKKPSGQAQEQKQLYVKQISSLWRTLTQEEKDSWESLAFDYKKYGAEYVWRPELSNYHKFMSYNLKRISKGLDLVKFLYVPEVFIPPISFYYFFPYIGYSFEVLPPEIPAYNLYSLPLVTYSLEVLPPEIPPYNIYFLPVLTYSLNVYAPGLPYNFYSLPVLTYTLEVF